jgi:hypothetical protein
MKQKRLDELYKFQMKYIFNLLKIGAPGFGSNITYQGAEVMCISILCN